MKNLNLFRSLLLVSVLLVPISYTVAEEICGNPETPTTPPKKECETEGGSSSGGVNTFHAYTGNIWRNITDIQLPASVGQSPIEFTRLTTSRYLGALPTPFGPAGSWRHNYLWYIHDGGTNGIGEEIVIVEYPDGSNWEFSKSSTGATYLTAVSKTQDRVEKSGSAPDRYNLWQLDGSRLEFIKATVNNETIFKPVGEYDKHNVFYAYTIDTQNRVTRVTDPAGHYLQINYGPVGDFSTAYVEFNYTNANAASVSVAGDFNGWNSQAHQMVRTGDDWQITVPVQAGSSASGTTWQYKFVIDGSSWLSDPANPETFPAGGPSTGNNSVLHVDYGGDDLDFSASVPVLIEITAPGASQVVVAGSFNGWSTTANILTQNGDTWTAQIDLGQGDHYYKIVVDGNWQIDAANPFTAPDGYGGFNSHLLVGPRLEAITDIQTSDGRSVFYSYTVHTSTATNYAALEAVDYLDGSASSYAYVTPFTPGGRPIIAAADDPRYAGAGSRITYEYQDTGVDGFISKEKNLVTGHVAVELVANDEIERRIVSGLREEVLTYENINLKSRGFNAPGAVPLEVSYFSNGYGMPASKKDKNGGLTSFERTWEFGAIKETTLPDGSTTSRTFTNSIKPFYVATRIDELGRTTTYTRDTDGRPTRVDFPDGSYETFTYNSFGQKLTHRLRNGGTESFAYDIAGQMISQTDALGHVTTFTYHPDGRKATETDSLGHSTSFEYNLRGQTTKVTYADGNFREMAYDTYGNLLSVKNEAGATTAYAYDEYNRKTFQVDPLGDITQYIYSTGANGCGSCGFDEKPDQMIAPDGTITLFSYNEEGQRVGETRAYGTSDEASTTYSYDPAGQLLATSDPNGNTWHYVYDDRGRRTSQTDPLGNVTTWTYDLVGNRLAEIRPGAAKVEMIYDVMDRVISQKDPLDNISHFAYDLGGRLFNQTDALNRTTAVAYDLLNRRVQTTYPDSTTTSQSYDATGNLLTQTDELGRVTSYLYDNRSRLVLLSNNLNEQFDYAYDEAGRRTAEMLPGGLTRHTTYDAAGRVIEVTTADGTAAEASVSYTYAPDGKMLTSTDAMGNTTSYTYNALGRQATVTTPLGLITSLSYDANGNLLTQTRPDGSVLTKTYDGLNRVVTETDAAGDIIAYGYTARGQLASITDSRNSLTQFAHDQMDRRITKTFADAAVEQTTYDSVGQMTQFTTARGITRNYTYDLRGRLTNVDYSDSTPDASYTYNAAGQQLAVSNADASITHNYDGVGRSAGETQTLAGHPLGVRTFALQHNVDSRLTQITYPGTGAPQITYGYDLRGNLASVGGNGFSVAYTRRLDNRISGMSFSNGVDNSRTYDADGRLTETANQRGSSAPFSRAAYTFNTLGQRTSVERANGSGDTFGYDAKDQVTSIGYEVPTPANGGTAQYAASFSYDAMGNRTSASTGFDPLATYTANNLNQYTAVSSFTAAPTYDADGNTLTVDGLDLDWDAENRLIEIKPIVAANGDRRIQYAYDPTGRRVRKTVDELQSGFWAEESDTHYTYWQWNVIEEHRDFPVATSETRRLTWGEDLSGTFQGAGGVGGLLVQAINGGANDGAKWFYHYDGNGNVTELTDNSGATVATYRYTAFGDTWSISGTASAVNQYRFSTKPLDAEVISSTSTAFDGGLYYYGFRYYDPVTGRWPSRDPIEEMGGLNLYGFVGNNAFNFWDLLGLENKTVPFLFVSYFTEGCVPVVSVSFTAPSQLWAYVSELVSDLSFISGLMATNYRTDTEEISVPDCYILERDGGSIREETTYDLIDWRISFDSMPWAIDVCGNVKETVEWFWVPDPDDECCE